MALLEWLIVSAAAFGGLVALIYVMQRSLMYFPERLHTPPAMAGLPEAQEVATQGPNGPNISPKGSMVVFDDNHLAYWERSKKQALENLGHDKRVCVIYANFKAQRDGVLDSGFLRFYGKAELHESGIRDNIFKRANACRRGYWHRRADQDRTRCGRPRQATTVNLRSAYNLLSFAHSA